MLLLASLGRHQICSSVSDSTHERRRGQYCSISFARENSRKRVETGEAAIFSYFAWGPPPRADALATFPDARGATPARLARAFALARAAGAALARIWNRTSQTFFGHPRVCELLIELHRELETARRALRPRAGDIHARLAVEG